MGQQRIDGIGRQCFLKMVDFETFKSSIFHIKSKRSFRIRKQKRRLYVRKKVKMEQEDNDENKEEETKALKKPERKIALKISSQNF